MEEAPPSNRATKKGVDMTKEPVNQALKLFEELLDQMED